jgi:hypothetical protein
MARDDGGAVLAARAPASAAPLPADYVRLGDVARELDKLGSLAGLKYGVRDAWRRAKARDNGAKRAKFIGADDVALLQHATARLKATGQIEYTGEYGAELTTFVPFAFWLKTQGLLAGRRVLSYGGMRPYYYFLEDDEFAEKPDARHFLDTRLRDWPTASTWHATRQAWHVMPDYRARYRSQGASFPRPVLFVQNKFEVEDSRGPINYLPVQALDKLFERTADRFDVVYSRPRALPRASGYTADDNDDCDYPDLQVARRYGHVTVLEDLCRQTGAPYNLTKLEILAKSRLFVGVQGGGAHLLACFGDSLLLLLHYFGNEFPHAYALGPYKYLATPAPLLLLARRHWHFERGVELIGAMRPGGDDLWLDRETLPTVRRLRV